MMFKKEKAFLQHTYKYVDEYFTADDSSVMEGFEYFTTETYRNKPGAITSRFKLMLESQGIRGMLRLGKKLHSISSEY